MRVAAPRERLTEDLQALVEENLGMARAVAVAIWRTAPDDLEMNELVSLAYVGLVDAAARWRPYCESKSIELDGPLGAAYFTNYAKMYVRGSIYDQFRATDHATRGDRAKVRKLLDAGYGAEVGEREACERTGIDPREASKALASTAGTPLSLPSCPAPGEIDVGEDVDTETTAHVSYLLTVMVETIESLCPEAQQVLALHYYAGQELKVLAPMLGMTEGRASKLHTEAVMLVRDALRAAC